MLLIRSTLWRVGVQRKVAGCSVYYFFLAVVGQLGRFGLEFRTFIYLISSYLDFLRSSGPQSE